MKYCHKVQYYETDKMQIVHHSNYIRWMEEARMNFLSEIGFDYVAMEEKGIVSPVVSVKANYKKTVVFGDTIRIDTYVKKISGVKLVFGYEMYKETGELCTVGETEHCFVKQDGRFVRLKSEFPEFYEKFEQLMR